LKVLLLSQFFSTTKGGGEYIFKIIAKELAQNGHKVWVITNNVKDETYEENENLKIIRISPTLEYRGGLPPTFWDNISYVINSFLKGIQIVKQEKINLIHSNNFSPSLAGSLISYLTKVPHVTTIHDIFSAYDKDFWKKWTEQTNVSSINARLVPFFEKLMMKLKIDGLHTVSEATKNDILKIGTNKPIHIIPNCIEDKKRIKIDIKKNQIFYLGRLVFYKNIEVVLKAIKLISKKHPDIKLIIAGDGPHKKSLQQTVKLLGISENVTFLGYVSNNQKLKLLAESLALVFPSTVEGFGLVILESFQQKRPVLVSDLPPMSDIVENKKTGLVIDPSDEQKWADSIIQLIKNPDEANTMGQNGYETLKKKYTEQIFYQNLIEMYKTIIK
jgi:glycosyltransferase involved in cell wall biosynthesis